MRLVCILENGGRRIPMAYHTHLKLGGRKRYMYYSINTNLPIEIIYPYYLEGFMQQAVVKKQHLPLKCISALNFER